MRLGSAALVVLVIGACGKGAERAQPAPAAGSAAAGSAAPPAPQAPGRPDVPAAVALPLLGGDAFLESVPAGLLVIVGDTAIVLDGNPAVPIRDGAVPASDLAATATDLRIPKIVAWAAAWHQLPIARGAVVSLAVKPSQPAALVLQVIASFAPSTQRDFALLVRGVEGVGALPVRILDAPAELTLALGATRAVLASRPAGDAPPETIAELTVDGGGAWMTGARQALTELLGRRAAAAPRPAIVIEVEQDCPVGTLAAAVAAVRRDDHGQPLVADVGVTRAAPAARTPTAAARDGAVNVALDEAEVARFAEALLASGDSDHAVDDMQRRLPGSDLGAQLDDVRAAGAKVAVGGGGSVAIGGGTRDRVGDAGRGPGQAAADVAGPTPMVAVQRPAQLTDTSLTADVVAQKLVAAYLAGLRRCYGGVLKVDPEARGGATLAFTVEETGRVGAATVTTTLAPSLASCVETLARSWRFATPRDADGEPVAAEFRVPLEFAPG